MLFVCKFLIKCTEGFLIFFHKKKNFKFSWMFFYLEILFLEIYVMSFFIVNIVANFFFLLIILVDDIFIGLGLHIIQFDRKRNALFMLQNCRLCS